MHVSKNGKGWAIGFFILLGLLIVTTTTNYQKSNKISYLNSQLSAARIATSQATQSQSQPVAATPTLPTPNPIQSSAIKQTWLCNSSLYTGFSSVNVDVLCPSSTGGTAELSCMGSISTSLTSQSYQYAPLDMTCTTQ